MKNLILIAILTILFGIISPLTHAQVSKYSVMITLKNVQERKGTIRASITNDEANFPAVQHVVDNQKLELTANNELVITFKDIPAGKYAILLYQDLNGNGELDRNGLIPSEPFGFSMLSMLMGPPSFEACAFTLDENKTMNISLISF